MGNGIRVKHNHVLKNQNRTRTKSYSKEKKLMEWLVLVLKKKQVQGNSSWVVKTMEKVNARLKSFGVTSEMVKDYLQKKGLSDLLS